MFSKILRTIFGLLLIPVAIGVGQAFYSEVSTLSLFSNSLRLIERGILVYFIVHIFLFRPVYIYVLSHELVHVFATWLCGGAVVAFNVTPSGGNVVTSKTNFFIELSPYFVPLYTILLGIIFWFVRAAGGGGTRISAIFLFLVGLTMAFHFVMTSDVLRMEQPDIIKSGLIFSFIVIFVFNLIVVMGVFAPIFDSISFTDFVKLSWSRSGDVYGNIYTWIMEFANNPKFW